MPLFGPAGERIGFHVYRTTEDTPPLFLIHGFTASSASFQSNIAELSRHFAVVAVDLLGHGDSESPDAVEPYTPERAVYRIIALMDYLGMDRILLCGHSLGGALALRVALDHPDRIAGLVIINSNSAAGTTLWREETQPRMEEMARRIRLEGTRFIKDSRLYPARSRRIPDEARIQLVRDFEKLTPAGIAGTAEGLVARVNAFERLPELSTPTLLVVGDRDRDFVVNAPRMLANMRRSSVQLVTIEDAGHAANLEQPELFHEALLGFGGDIGFLPESAKAGRKRSARVLVIGSVLTAAVAGIGGAYIIMNRDNGAPAGGFVPPTLTPTLRAGETRPAGTGTAAAGATTAPAGTETPTPVPGTPTPTPRPTNTPLPTATLRPGQTPPPTNTPTQTPTLTPTPSATNTPTSLPTTTPTRTNTPAPTSTPTNTPIPPKAITISKTGGQNSRTYTATVSGGPATVSWSASDGAVASPGTGLSTTVTFPNAGTYNVTAVATFADGTTRTASDSVTIQ